MKIQVIKIDGSKIAEIELPSFFREKIREDLILRGFLSLQIQHKQPYGAYILAGKEVSASGKQSHRRRKYKTLYGHGISRVPRKVLSRRGNRFFWVGAFAPGTVGGREAHPPIPVQKIKKINKKEKRKALISALAATSSVGYVKRRYEKYAQEIKEIKLPLIIDKVEGKGKEIKKLLLSLLEKNIGTLAKRLLTTEKKVRAGKGKMRGRKYKKKVGLLLVISNEEKKKKINFDNFGIETIEAKKLSINHLAPGAVPGRFTIYTSRAIEELKNRIEKK